MGCPTEIVLNKNLVFSIATHDPDTGNLTDADVVPTYRIYEEDSDTPILTGNMSKQDDANTTGYYSKKIMISASNGFSINKTYTIYIEATVDGDTGGITYAFFVEESVITSSVVVTNASNSRTSFKTDLVSTVTNHWKDCLLRITSGILLGQVKKVSAYNGTTKVISVYSGFTSTPAADTTFELINK